MKLGRKEVQKELRFSFALQKQIKENYNTASSVEKSTTAKVVAGKIIKKYKCLKR